MEIAAHVNSTVKGVWLVEDDKSNLQSARALVTNHNEMVPLRVVNTNLTPITLHTKTVELPLQKDLMKQLFATLF